ncbi:MAG: hypothetical protein AB2805_18285 [Candidatus Thiodiazotropha sp.]
MSADIGRLYYEIGGGKALPPPGSGIYTFTIRSTFNSGFGYSCGTFNYHSNITQMINQFMSQVRQIPGQLMDAFSAAIAGLPNYLLMKANASLYNTINNTLDETTELFRLSYKSCQQIEEELRANPASNPYQGFIRASILDTWHFGADSGDNIADVHQQVKEDPVNPIIWFGGNQAGTVDNPIQINRDLVIAGYNIMIGRTGDVSVITAPTGPAALQPIVRIWPNPAEAGRWVQEVLGDELLVLQNDPPLDPESIPGKGLRPLVDALEPEILDALMEVYDHNNYDLMNNYISLPSISGKLADGLRTLPRHEVLVLTDRLVSEMAVKEVQERLFLIRQMIFTALKAPDLLASHEAGSTVKQYVYEKTFPSIRDSLEEIVNDLELRQRTINQTMLTILDRSEAFRKSGRSKQSGNAHREQRVE